MDSESINHAQKQKMFRHIRALDADKIVIDLGAGTHVNTLDTFLLADKMIVVTVPEVTAIENMYQFIKSVYYRKLKSIFKTHNLSTLVQDTWQNRASHNIRNLKDLIAYIKQDSERICRIFDLEMAGFLLHIVLNEVRTPKDILIGENLERVCQNLLGMHVLYSGYVSQDDAVQKNVNSQEPFMLFNRLSPVVSEIRKLTDNLENDARCTIPEELLDGRA
jgi:flagellar biosynthesis protein FlhG